MILGNFMNQKAIFATIGGLFLSFSLALHHYEFLGVTFVCVFATLDEILRGLND